MLYQLEQPPFQAQVDANKASIEQLEAQHRNAEITLERAQTLLKGPAGRQSDVDSALAAERALAAQIAGAQAHTRERCGFCITHATPALTVLDVQTSANGLMVA